MSKRAREDKKKSVSAATREWVRELDIVPPGRWRDIPMAVYGLVFGFLNLWEITRFLYATGRIGRDTLFHAFRSQLVVNFGPPDWALMRNEDAMNRLLDRLADRVQVVRIHMPEATLTYSMTIRWVRLFRSADLEIIDIRFRHGSQFNSTAYLEREMPRLRVLQWESQESYVDNRVLARLLPSCIRLQELRLRFQDLNFIGDDVLKTALPYLTALRLLSCPVSSLHPWWFDDALSLHCPLLEHIEFDHYDVVSPWATAGTRLGLQRLLTRCHRLVYFCSREQDGTGQVCWSRHQPGAVWTLTLTGATWLHMPEHEGITLSMLFATTGVDPVNDAVSGQVKLDVQTEKPRRLLAWLLEASRQHERFRVQSLTLRHPKTGGDWVDLQRGWLEPAILRHVVALWIPRGLERLWLYPDQNELRNAMHGEVPEYLKLDRLGDDQWTLRASYVSERTLGVLLDRKQWTPGWTVWDYQPGVYEDMEERMLLPHRTYEELAQAVPPHRLRVLRLGHQHPYRTQWQPLANVVYAWPHAVTLEAKSFAGLEVLDTGNHLMPMQRGLWRTWAHHLPQLRSLSTAVYHAIEQDDWLAWHHLTELRVRQLDIVDPRPGERMLSKPWPSRIDPAWLNNDSLRRLCDQNPQLETLRVELQNTGVTDMGVIELKQLRVLHMTLAVPRVNTEQLARLKRYCSQLVQVDGLLAPPPRDDVRPEYQPQTLEEARWFLEAFAPGGNLELRPNPCAVVRRRDESELDFVRRQQGAPESPDCTELSLRGWDVGSPQWWTAQRLWSTWRSIRLEWTRPPASALSTPPSFELKRTETSKHMKISRPKLLELGQQAHRWNRAHPVSTSERHRFKRWRNEILAAELEWQHQTLVHDMMQRFAVLGH